MFFYFSFAPVVTLASAHLFVIFKTHLIFIIGRLPHLAITHALKPANFYLIHNESFGFQIPSSPNFNKVLFIEHLHKPQALFSRCYWESLLEVQKTFTFTTLMTGSLINHPSAPSSLMPPVQS